MPDNNLHQRIKEVLTNKQPRTPNSNPDDSDADSSVTVDRYFDVFNFSHISNKNSGVNNQFNRMCNHLLGCPHQFLSTADFRIDEHNEFGYCFAKDVFNEKPVITLMPGRMEFLPDYSKKDKKSFSSLMGSIERDSDKRALEELIGENAEDRYYDFASDHATYIRYVNLMCRIAALYLGIEDRVGPDGKTTYERYDWSNYQVTKDYKTPLPDDAGVFDVMSDIASDMMEKLKKLGDDALAGHKQYVHFYADPSTSVSESYSNNTQKSQLEGAFDSVEGIVKEAAMLLQTASEGASYVGDFLSTAGQQIAGLANTVSFGLFENLLGVGQKEVLRGANLIYPEIWTDSGYSKTYNMQFNFISPYGDREAIYLNCLVPVLHLLGFSLPKQTTANTFSSPFLLKAFAKGWFSCNLGIVESISIDRGPESTWSVEGLPTQMKVTLTVKDLYSQLMMSPSNKPSLFFSNQSLMDYLASMCGVDLTEPNIVLRYKTMWSLFTGAAVDIPSNIYQDLTQSIFNTTKSLFYN